MACHQGPADTSTHPVRSPARSQCWPPPVSSTSTNSMNGRRSRRIPIPLSAPHMRPAPNRAIAIRRSVSAKNAPMHPLGPRLATTCNNAIESLTREPDKPDKPIRRRQRPPRRRHPIQQSAVRVVCPRVSTRAIAPSRRAPRSPACGATGRLSALALSWPFSNQRCNRLGIATLLYLRAAVHTDWLRSALTTNTYTHAYTSTPGENGEFENISQDTDCIGPPCRIRTCDRQLRRPQCNILTRIDRIPEYVPAAAAA